jgi:hypothetical protein
MLRGLRSFLKRLTGSSLQRSDFDTASRQHVENYDAAAASSMANVDPLGPAGPADFPPNYVRPVDEGRPRK